MDALDPAELDIRGRRRARDERDGTTFRGDEIAQAGDRLGHEVNDLGVPDDANVQVRHERERAPALCRPCGEDDGSRLGDPEGAAGDHTVEGIESPRVELEVVDELDPLRPPRAGHACRCDQASSSTLYADRSDRRRDLALVDSADIRAIVRRPLVKQRDGLVTRGARGPAVGALDGHGTLTHRGPDAGEDLLARCRHRRRHHSRKLVAAAGLRSRVRVHRARGGGSREMVPVRENGRWRIRATR